MARCNAIQVAHQTTKWRSVCNFNLMHSAKCNFRAFRSVSRVRSIGVAFQACPWLAPGAKPSQATAVALALTPTRPNEGLILDVTVTPVASHCLLHTAGCSQRSAGDCESNAKKWHVYCIASKGCAGLSVALSKQARCQRHRCNFTPIAIGLCCVAIILMARFLIFNEIAYLRSNANPMPPLGIAPLQRIGSHQYKFFIIFRY